MEIFRDLGIEDRVMARALPHHLMGKQVFATSFAGREICRMMAWGTGDDRDYATASPCGMCNAPQHILEPILLDAARSFGADIRFDHEVVAVRQTPDEATARVRKRLDGTEFELRKRLGEQHLDSGQLQACMEARSRALGRRSGQPARQLRRGAAARRPPDRRPREPERRRDRPMPRGLGVSSPARRRERPLQASTSYSAPTAKTRDRRFSPHSIS
jgi:hypothetical protein